MTDEENQELSNLIYLLEIHHIDSSILIRMKNLIQKQQEELTRTKTDLQNAWHNNLELAEKCLKQDKIIKELREKLNE